VTEGPADGARAEDPSRAPSGRSPRWVPGPLVGKSELLVALLLLALGVLIAFEMTRLDVPAVSGVVGPRFFPVAVAVLLLVVGVWLAVDVLRGGHGDPEIDEDVDPEAPSDWITIAGITVSFAAHTALVRPAGWPIAGAVLFWGVAASLGASKLRAAVVAVVLAGLVFVLFDRVLGVPLPAGVLEGVL